MSGAPHGELGKAVEAVFTEALFDRAIAEWLGGQPYRRPGRYEFLTADQWELLDDHERLVAALDAKYGQLYTRCCLAAGVTFNSAALGAAEGGRRRIW